MNRFRFFGYGIVTVGVVALCCACSPKAVMVRTTTGHTVPLTIPTTFAGTDWHGNRVALGDYRGKVVLIDFWATSCPPCVAQLPAIRTAYDRYHSRGFEVIGVSMDERPDRLEKFTRTHNMPWPQIKDPDGYLTNLYVPDAHGIPMAALFGRDGRLLAADIPESQLSSTIEDALRTL